MSELVERAIAKFEERAARAEEQASSLTGHPDPERRTLEEGIRFANDDAASYLREELERGENDGPLETRGAVGDDRAPEDWPAVEMVIDVIDDPPRPFPASVLEGDDWRANDEYRTKTYAPAPTQQLEKLLAAVERAKADNFKRQADLQAEAGDETDRQEAQYFCGRGEACVAFALDIKRCIRSLMNSEEGGGG